MEIENLKWDSDFFGLKVGRVSIADQNQFSGFDFINNAEENKYDLIYVFTHNKILNNDLVEYCNLDLVDIQVTMSKPFTLRERLLCSPNQYEFRTELSDIEKLEVYDIAEQTSIVSRFASEKLVGPEKTKGLYQKWIDNALNQSFSDGMFLFKENGSILGIHLIKTDEENKTGYFTLTGVNPAFKRMGIGRKLWIRSFAYWAMTSDIVKIKSPFSLQNIPSFNFHLKMGFNKIEDIKYIYHYRK